MSRSLESSHLKILVVEDNYGDFLLLKETFSLSGIAVQHMQLADTLSTAIEYLLHNTPDIIFLDLYLTDSSGLESFIQLKEYIRDAVLIILSGLSDTKTALEAITLGAQDYLEKGEFDEKLLEKTITYSIERRRNLETLRQANERYSLVTKATHDLIWDWDLLTNEIYRDEKAVKNVYGVDSNAAIRHVDKWHARLHPEDVSFLSSILQGIKGSPTNDFFEIEYRFLSDNGNYKYIFDRGFVVRDEAGMPIRLIGAAQDITERKRIQLELEKLSLIARETVNGVIIFDADQKITWTNEAFTRITEYSFEEATAKTPHFFLQNEDTSAQEKKIMQEKIDTGQPFHVELINYSRSRKKYWVRIEVQPIFDEKGKLIHFFAIQTDISARKHAENKIRISEEKYRHIFYNNPFPMFLYDEDTLQILECNNKTIDKYGYSREEFMQLTIRDLRLPEESGKADIIPEQTDETQNRLWKQVKKNGEIMSVEIFIYPIEYGGRKVRQAQINDVTEKLKLESALQEAQLAHQRAITEATIKGQENEREQLGTELHDNINQILATAKLYLDFALSRTPAPEEILIKSKEFITMATEEIRRLSKTLLPPALEEFGLITALDELFSAVSITGDFTAEKKWDSFDERVLKKDQKLTIYRIAQEQLNNIIKHATAKKVIIVLQQLNECGQKKVELLIKDDGKGFDINQKRNGVGLRNIMSRVELFGGTVIIQSRPGFGCEIKVSFPANGDKNH